MCTQHCTNACCFHINNQNSVEWSRSVTLIIPVVLCVIRLSGLLPTAYTLYNNCRTAPKLVQFVKKYPCLYNSNLAEYARKDIIHHHSINTLAVLFVGRHLYAWLRKQHNTFSKLCLVDSESPTVVSQQLFRRQSLKKMICGRYWVIIYLLVCSQYDGAMAWPLCVSAVHAGAVAGGMARRGMPAVLLQLHAPAVQESAAEVKTCTITFKY